MEDKQYDIAVSFAGEQRDYVERVVAACKQRGLVVFYDRDKNNDWWGGNFIRQQRTVYSSRTRFFVPFISNEYLSRPIPMDEFSSAMMTAVKQGDGYILPVLMGNTPFRSTCCIRTFTTCARRTIRPKPWRTRWCARLAVPAMPDRLPLRLVR